MSSELPERPINVAVLMRESFRVLNNLVLQRLAEEGHDAVRTAHGAVFQFLDDSGTTVSVLAERAGISKQTMADLVRHLEQHDYLVRVPDPTDGRAKLVLPTDRGREVVEIAQATVPDVENRVVELIGQGRMRQLREDLTTIVTELWDACPEDQLRSPKGLSNRGGSTISGQ